MMSKPLLPSLSDLLREEFPPVFATTPWQPGHREPSACLWPTNLRLASTTPMTAQMWPGPWPVVVGGGGAARRSRAPVLAPLPPTLPHRTNRGDQDNRPPTVPRQPAAGASQHMAFPPPLPLLVSAPVAAPAPVPSPAREFVCAHEGCLAVFKFKGSLVRHTRTHTGERPFRCPYEDCEKAFTASCNLSRHVKCHTNERPFVCGFVGCGKRFASGYHQRRHEKVHTKPASFRCAACGKTFKHAGFLNRHKCEPQA